MSSFTSTDRPAGYRSTQRVVHSSSDDDSDEGEEDTPLWRQKKEKYFRKQKDNQSSMQTQLGRDLGQCMQQSKKVNNIWGSVLTEQDLTQTLVSSAAVDKPNEQSVNERNVESYDFTKKYSEDRLSRHSEQSLDWSGRNIQVPDNTDTASSSRGRRIIDYEDTLSKPKESDDLRTHLSRKSRKRRADFSGDRKHRHDTGDFSGDRKHRHDRGDFSGDRKRSDIHRRLGNKKLTTTRLGEIDITVDMEDSIFVNKVADFLNEPKSDLIARIVEHLGKDVALRILKATKDVEETGGMYTMDGSRRRTAGGVYFTLLKQQPEFNNKIRSQIFVQEDPEAFKKHRKDRRKKIKAEKRAAAKRAKGNIMDIDRPKSPAGKEGGKMNEGDGKKEEEEMEDGEIKEENEEKNEGRTEATNEHSDSSDSSSEEDSPRGKKTSNLSFEEELAAAKKLILEKSKSSESMDEKSTVEMTDLDVAEAHVVDIELDC